LTGESSSLKIDNRDMISFVNVNCLLLNARSIRNKVDALPLFITRYSASVVMLCETWLSPAVPNSFLKLHSSHNCIRKDRLKSDGGGVCAFICKSLEFCQIELVDKFENLELLCFDVYFPVLTVRFILLYRPPYYDPLSKAYMHDVLSCLDHLDTCEWPTIITGDINLPEIDWSLYTAPNDDVHLPFLERMINNGFSQLVTEPTRQENTLDLVLCNDPLLISDCRVGVPFGCGSHVSDHCTVVFSMTLPDRFNYNDVASLQPPFVYTKDFKHADFVSINHFLNGIDWYGMLANDHDVNSIWSNFTTALSTAIDLFVPTRKVTVRGKGDYKHYPRHIQRMFDKKCAAWRLYKKFKTDSLKKRYYNYDNLCENAIIDYYNKLESELIDSGDLGAFYRYVNNKIVCDSGVAALKDSRGEIVVDSTAKAELLNTFLAVFLL
jgi:hypothetical protein